MAAKITGNSFTTDQRIILGCRALAEKNISQLAREYDTNHEFIYSQKNKVREILREHYNIPESDVPVLLLNKETLEKTVIGCITICKGSTENT